MDMFFVYIIQSVKTKKYYVGCTNNGKRRLGEHNKGLSKYTKSFTPWVLMYTEQFGTLSKARMREKGIKSWKKRIAIEKLINQAAIV
jgi:putative endonuclease